MNLLCDHLPPGPVVLDASAIINLLGCGDMARVLSALGTVCVVEERTLKEVQRHPIPGFDHTPMLEQLQRAGALRVERMTSVEYLTYLSLIQGTLTSRLDEGESAAIALTERGYSIILDENKARCVVSNRFPNLRFCSTLRLLATAAIRGGWMLKDVQQLVFMARRNSRMGVPREENHMLSKLMNGVDGWPYVRPPQV